MANHPSFLTYLVQAIEQYRADRQPEITPESSPTPKRGQRLLRWFLPNGGTLLIVLTLLMTQYLWARPFAALNAPGPSATTVNYQGRLADSAGAPLDGTYGMSFALYDAATEGTRIWGPEPHTAVPVSEGLFSVGLGSQTSGGIPTTVWNGDRYLEINVSGETLSPRELIRSVPIAGMALTVPDGAIGTNQIANGAIESDKLAVSYETIILPSDQTVTASAAWTHDPIPGLTLTVNLDNPSIVLIWYKVTAQWMSDVDNRLSICATGLGCPAWGDQWAGGAGIRTLTNVQVFNLAAGTNSISINYKTNTAGSQMKAVGDYSSLGYVVLGTE